MEQSNSAARNGSTSQPPQAGTAEAAADSQCPICLGEIENAAYVAYCMHRFCFVCIQLWAASNQICPICRQPFEQLLHSVRGDNSYEEYVVGLPTRLYRTMAMERTRSRSPQHRYSLRRRPTDDQPTGSRVGPVGQQPLELLLPPGRREDDHDEHVVGLPARPRRRMAPERTRSRSPQRQHRRLNDDHPSAGRRGPAGTNRRQRRRAASGPSNGPCALL